MITMTLPSITLRSDDRCVDLHGALYLRCAEQCDLMMMLNRLDKYSNSSMMMSILVAESRSLTLSISRAGLGIRA